MALANERWVCNLPVQRLSTGPTELIAFHDGIVLHPQRRADVGAVAVGEHQGPDIRAVVRGAYPGDCHVMAVHDEPGLANGFSEATVWCVETPRGWAALRRIPAGAVDPGRLNAIHQLSAFVFHAGLTSVPVPFRTASGATFHLEAGDIWQLEPWMPGSPRSGPFRRSVSTRVVEGFCGASAVVPVETSDVRWLSAAMRGLAAWHASARAHAARCPSTWFGLAQRVPPFLGNRRQRLAQWSPSRAERVQHALQTGPVAAGPHAEVWRQMLADLPECVIEAERALERNAASAVACQPCLVDVWRPHVLFVDDALTGLIDPFEARTDSIVVDLARLLGSLVGDDRSLWEFAVAEYESLRPLSHEERLLLVCCDVSGVVLTAMHWLERLTHITASPKVPEAMAARVVEVRDRLHALRYRLQSG